MVYKSNTASKHDVSKQEVNELKRKRKIFNNSKIENKIKNQKVTNGNPSRTLLIKRAIRGENLE